MGIGYALGQIGTSILWGTGYGLFTRVGHEGIGDAFQDQLGLRDKNTTRSKYYGAPSNFKLPYYRYKSRYGRRYGRRYRKRSYFGRKRFFSRYRTRRFY